MVFPVNLIKALLRITAMVQGDKPVDKSQTKTVEWKPLRVKSEAFAALDELRRVTGERYNSEAIVKAVKIINAFKNEWTKQLN